MVWKRPAKLACEGRRVDLCANVAFSQPVQKVERQLRRSTHRSLARIHIGYARVVLGARSCSPTSVASRSATVHQSNDSVTSEAFTIRSRSPGM